MKTFNREEAEREFDNFWNELTEEWFKVEVLQDYSGEDDGESLRVWMAGRKEEAMRLIKESAQSGDWVRTNANKRFKSVRIHVVEEPYSEYLSWEIEYYKLVNIPLIGEQVYLVKKAAVKDMEMPDGDFMIFDNKKVVRNYYSPEGRMYKADFYYEEDDISKFLEFKERLLALATPLESHQ